MANLLNTQKGGGSKVPRTDLRNYCISLLVWPESSAQVDIKMGTGELVLSYTCLPLDKV